MICLNTATLLTSVEHTPFFLKHHPRPKRFRISWKGYVRKGQSQACTQEVALDHQAILIPGTDHLVVGFCRFKGLKDVFQVILAADASI